MNRKTTEQRVASAAQVRWEAESVSCAKHEPVVAPSLPHAVYSCPISGMTLGLAPVNEPTLTTCHGISKTGHILDVTNTVVYLRRHGQAFGLPCK